MDDPISRQVLKRAMYHEAFEVVSEMQKWDGGCWIRYELVEKIVDSMPSVQPKQKTGRWIYGQDELFVSCSECGMETTRNEIRGIALFGKDEPKFCPNCGAKMERENSKSNE